MKQGKVRFIGASNYSGARLAEALETSRKNGLASYISLQPHYNMMERSAFETELLPVVEKNQIGVIPYYSLAGGFLTGKYILAEMAVKRVANVRYSQLVLTPSLQLRQLPRPFGPARG